MTDEDNGMIRRSKDKPPKGPKPDANALKGTSEERLLAKLQKESLKVHGDPLDPKKKRADGHFIEADGVPDSNEAHLRCGHVE